MKFELSPESLKIKSALKKDFLEIEMKAISTANPNRNGSHFTKEALEKAIPTFYNKPVLGSFSVDTDDFRGHESELKYDKELESLYYDYTDSTSETPLGMIRSEDRVYIANDSIDGLSWIHFTCCLWVKYNYRQIKRLLKSKNGKKKISVEIEVNESYVDENGIEVITDFTFDGVTILSDKLETGIADAEMTILDKVESALFQKKQKCLCYAYDALNTVNNPIEKQDFNDNDEYEDNEVFSSDESIDDANENKEEITMNQEGGNEKMLTYEAKRTLLEAFLSDNVNHNDSCYCAWVCDLDDNTVYFSYDGKYFMAPYSISQDEEGNGSVSVNLEEKQAVVRSWSIFTEDNNESQDASTIETFEVDSEIEGVDNNQQENFAEEKPEDNEEDKKETESYVDSTDCFDDDKDDKNDDVNDDDDEDNKDEDNKETESCGNKETESCTDSTNCFENPDEDKPSDENNEDNKETESCEDKETESIENKEEESCVDSTNCFSEETQTEEVPSELTQREFVTIGDENLNIDELLEKYTALNEQFATLNADYQVLFTQEQERQLNNMINFGYDLVDAESRLSDDEQKKFIKEQIKDKCEKGEFVDNDALKNFAVTQLALALYNSNATVENNNNNNESNKADFCVDIVIPEVKHIESDAEKLRNLTKKLNRI